MPGPEQISQWIAQLKAAGTKVGFQVESFGQIQTWPLLAMTRNGSGAQKSGQTIYISSGIHGDEPAGPLAVLELLQTDALPRTHHYVICPLLNPSGLASGTRENSSGIDLNRDYRDLLSEETRSHTDWIESTLQTLDLCLHLHEDWESQGFYLYELNATTQPGYADAILQAASKHLAIETATTIDGHKARNGLIRHKGIPEIKEGSPEAIYFQKRFGGLNYTLEAPSSQALKTRVAALKAAILSALQACQKGSTNRRIDQP